MSAQHIRFHHPDRKIAAAWLLKLVHDIGKLEVGIEKQELSQMYNKSKREQNFVSPWFALFLFMLSKKYITRKRANQSKDFVHFNVEKVKLFLKQEIISTPVTVSNRNGSDSSIFLNNQRYVFQDKKIKNSTILKKADNWCTICNKKLENDPSHFREDLHLAMEIFRGVSGKKKLEDIKISGIDVKELTGILQVHTIQENKQETEINFCISNNLKVNVCLNKVFLLFGNAALCKFPIKQDIIVINAESTNNWTFHLFGPTVGRFDLILAFKFTVLNLTSDKEITYIMKQISFRVDDFSTTEEGTDEALTLPSVQNMKPNYSDLALPPYKFAEIAEPLKKSERQLKYTVPLPEFEIPVKLLYFINTGFGKNEKLSEYSLDKKIEYLNVLVKGLNKENYARFFSMMLHFEEHQSLCDLRSYSMTDTPIIKCVTNPQLFQIDVPGLSENRPSVLKGDEIFISIENQSFKGWVQNTAENCVHIKLGPQFASRFIKNLRVKVDFSFNRLGFKLEHRAVQNAARQAHLTENICYPTKYGLFKTEKKFNFINKQIENNAQQATVVKNILNGSSLPAPYIIFGPPGTGKTVTMVEAIQQIFHLDSANAHILAVAPSNAATDLLAERIAETVPASKIFRMYSRSRYWDLVPEKLRKISNFVNTEVCYPSLEKLKNYSVIICTIICSGRLASAGFPDNHFSHIFIDECGHAMEPTALVSIAGLLKIGSNNTKPGQLVLSGDPKQLGPVIRSPVAKSLGLATSFIERLMSLDLYKPDKLKKYNENVISKLLQNFRSHPDILKVPNELFYNAELEAHADHYITYAFSDWEELPTRGFPIIFHGVEGKDEKEPVSPSYFNVAEVNIVVNYVEKLLDGKFKGQKLNPADIGIISPYRRQVLKLHRALQRKKISKISIGSVEEFQGQERKVIIISSVRSDPMKLQVDRKFRLGFIQEPKRFNVAITRAKSLVIVVGNPNILKYDSNWNQLLKFVLEKRGYTGCKFTLESLEEKTAENLDESRTPILDMLQDHLKAATNFKMNATPSNDDKLERAFAELGISSSRIEGTASEIATMVSVPMITHEQ